MLKRVSYTWWSRRLLQGETDLNLKYLSGQDMYSELIRANTFTEAAKERD